MIIDVKQVGFSYCTRDVLRDVNFQVNEGEFISVIGPNGVGKTTLFRCLLGIHTKYQGNIFLHGKEVRQWKAKELAHAIAYIPQTREQTFSYSVEDMVLMGTAHEVGSFRQPSEKEYESAKEAMEKCHIAHLSQRSFTHLSGGEQQLVLVARALAQQAKILLMDEPTSSLDFGNQSMVLSCIRELTKEGYTAIVSTHNPQQALWYADKVLALQKGSVVGWGEANIVITNDLIRTLYGMDIQLISVDGEQFLSPKGGRNHV